MELPPDHLTRGQIISNWDDIYRDDNNPQWEDLEPNREFLSLIQGYCSPGMRVLEVGSGLGHNALALARMGIDVTASDCSQNAVRRCGEMAGQERVSMTCRVLDIMCLPADVGTYDLVFDKGCWHTFFEDGHKERYVEQIACSRMVGSGSTRQARLTLSIVRMIVELTAVHAGSWVILFGWLTAISRSYKSAEVTTAITVTDVFSRGKVSSGRIAVAVWRRLPRFDILLSLSTSLALHNEAATIYCDYIHIMTGKRHAELSE